ncbi:MAG: hypothetical protein KDA24_16580 [Deltaproteobacteria bacterium]|nr:hypothetical protein [Deltaproteobacteria bacterium]
MLQPRPSAPTRLRDVLAEALLYSFLAAAVLWPLPTAMATAVPMGTEKVATVPFAMAWSFWWQADRLAAGLQGYWQAPIFFPTDGTFALSETNTLGSLLMAPVVLATGSAALGHNLFLLLALTLNGLTTSRFLQALGLGRLVAVVTGVGVLMLPLPHQEIGVLPLVPVFGIVASLHALWSWTRDPGWRLGVRVGLCLAATYLLCFQYALFLAIVVAALGWLFLEKRFLAPRPLGSLVLAGALAAGCVAPVVLAQTRTVKEEAGFVRKESKVRKLAAKPRHFARTPWKQAVAPPGIPVAKKPGWKAFFPGSGRVLLALLGLVWGLGLPRRVRWAWFFGGGSLLAYAMALGPWLEVGGNNLWALVVEVLPGYGKVRSVNRWAVIFQLFVVLLAGFGLQSLQDRLTGRAPSGGDAGLHPARGRRRLITGVAFAVLALLCMVEIVPPQQVLRDVPSKQTHAAWGEWVRQNTPHDAVLAFLPFSDGGNVADYEQDAAWMLLTPVHGRTMVNGYSSYFPKPFRALKKKLKEFPTIDGVDGLRELGVTHVVMEQEALPEHLIADYPVVEEALTILFRDDVAGVDVYALD